MKRTEQKAGKIVTLDLHGADTVLGSNWVITKIYGRVLRSSSYLSRSSVQMMHTIKIFVQRGKKSERGVGCVSQGS